MVLIYSPDGTNASDSICSSSSSTNNNNNNNNNYNNNNNNNKEEKKKEEDEKIIIDLYSAVSLRGAKFGESEAIWSVQRVESSKIVFLADTSYLAKR